MLALDQRVVGTLGGALAPKLPPPPTGRYPPMSAVPRAPDQDCSEAILFGWSRLDCEDVQVRLSSGSETSGSSASTSVWRPGLRRLGRGGHLCGLDKIIGFDLSEAWRGRLLPQGADGWRRHGQEPR